jgi:inorganic pyrophosphatase
MNGMPERLTVRIEVARGGRVKRRPDGSIDFVSPFASPFAYGSVVDTMAADGDPEDALVLGAAPARGTTVVYPVWGRVRFVDAGLEDPKWVVGPQEPTLVDWAQVETFFVRYAWAKRLLYRLRFSPNAVHFEGVERAPAVSG